jgi:hypothetical protein
MRVLVLCLAAFLAACGASRVPFTSYAPGPAVAPSSVGDAELYQAARTVFAAHGLALAEDDGASVVASKPRPVGSKTLHAWRATVIDGSLQLDIDCFVETRAGREVCEGTQRARPWQEQAPRLRADIFAEAERLAAR